jgi:DNA-binding NtrC family response regulator
MAGAQIIVADDEIEIRRAIGDMLAATGLTVLQAADGVEALQLVTDNPGTTLLLSDVKMPRMNGYDLVEAALDLRPELKVLMMTGYAHDHPPPAALRAREIRVLVKPVRMDRLSALVEDMLSRP